MKRLLIICSMLALTGFAHAQTATPKESAWEDNENNDQRAVTRQGNDFAGTEMSLNQGKVTFTGLPELPRPTWAVVTNSTGDFLKQSRVSPQNNTMDVSRLHEGNLYFVTIVYKNKSKKAFTLNL